MGLIQKAGNLFRGLVDMANQGTAYIRPPAYRNISPARRRTEYDIAITLYQGAQRAILENDIRNTFQAGEAEQLIKQGITFNILAMIVDKLAMLYKEAPTFECKGNTGLVELFGDELVSTMKTADRISELCGLAFVGVTWNAQKKKLEHICIPPDQADPRWHPFKEGVLEGLTVYSWDTASDGKRLDYRTVWSPEEYHIFRNNEDVTERYLEAQGVQTGTENTYQVVPFAAVYPRRPLAGDHWGQTREDAVLFQRTLNQKLTELQMLLKYQSGSLLAWIGALPQALAPSKDGKGGGIVVGNSNVLHVPPSGDGSTPDVKFISPQARISEMWETIQKMILMAAKIAHLGGEWQLDGAPKQSGIALKIANSDLIEYREDKEDSHKAFWSRYSDLCATVAKNGGGAGTGTAEGFTVEFGEPETVTDPIVDAQVWALKIQADVANTVEWAMALHPDKDEKAAKKYVADNAAARKEAQASGRPAMSPPDAFIKGGKKPPEEAAEDEGDMMDEDQMDGAGVMNRSKDKAKA